MSGKTVLLSLQIDNLFELVSSIIETLDPKGKDIVFVEGYKESFSVTLYETAKFQYIPYI